MAENLDDGPRLTPEQEMRLGVEMARTDYDRGYVDEFVLRTLHEAAQQRKTLPPDDEIEWKVVQLPTEPHRSSQRPFANHKITGSGRVVQTTGGPKTRRIPS